MKLHDQYETPDYGVLELVAISYRTEGLVLVFWRRIPFQEFEYTIEQIIGLLNQGTWRQL